MVRRIEVQGALVMVRRTGVSCTSKSTTRFALYAWLSRLTSVSNDKGRFDSLVMVIDSPRYAGSQREFRCSGCDPVRVVAGIFLGVGSGVGVGFSIASGCDR